MTPESTLSGKVVDFLRDEVWQRIAPVLLLFDGQRVAWRVHLIGEFFEVRQYIWSGFFV